MTFLRNSMNAAAAAEADFRVACGLVVRAVGGQRVELELLSEMFGEAQPASLGAADIVIRFTTAPGRRMRVETRAENDASVRVRRHPLAPRTNTWVRLDFTRFGDSREIVYPHDAGALPLLTELLAAAAVRKGWLALHASAFTFSDHAVLFVGSKHSGKSGLLLSFAAAGARVVGDDCILLARDGREIIGLDRRIGVSARHLRELEWLAGRLSPQPLYALRAMSLLGVKGKVPVGASELFETPVIASRLPLKVFISVETSSRSCSFDPCAPADAVALLMRSAEDHRRALADHYSRWKAHSPGQACAWMEDLPTLSSAHLHAAVEDAEVYIFRHPRRAPYALLTSALRGFLEGRESSSVSAPVEAASLKAVMQR